MVTEQQAITNTVYKLKLRYFKFVSQSRLVFSSEQF